MNIGHWLLRYAQLVCFDKVDGGAHQAASSEPAEKYVSFVGEDGTFTDLRVPTRPVIRKRLARMSEIADLVVEVKVCHARQDLAGFLLHTGADKLIGSHDNFAQPGLGREGRSSTEGHKTA